MAPLQIIGAGYARTGTDSLREALNTLGYNTHHMKAMFQDPEQKFDDFSDAAMNNGDADWDRIYAKYSAGVDFPTCTFYKELMAKYPDAKVILTVRDADSWYNSVKNTIFPLKDEPNTDNERSKSLKRMMKAVVLDSIFTDPERFHKEEEIKKMFLDHNEEVIQYVPADRLYVMQIGEGWEGLCKFLGKEVPDTPYPRSNSAEDFGKGIKVLRSNFLKNQK